MMGLEAVEPSRAIENPSPRGQLRAPGQLSDVSRASVSSPLKWCCLLHSGEVNIPKQCFVSLTFPLREENSQMKSKGK